MAADEGAEEARKLGLVEVADGAAEKDEQRRQALVDGGEALFVARMDAVKLDLGKISADRGLRSEQARRR